MNPCDRYLRHPTRAAIDSLAQRFGLRNDPGMQDWEYEVADAKRLPDFLPALEGDDLTDDERFVLGMTVMQCFEELASERTVADSEQWKRFVAVLRSRPKLHAHTICYWSSLDRDLEDAWHIAPLVRRLWTEVQKTLE